MVTMSHVSGCSRASDPDMDPDCALCSSPASVACRCEEAALDKALRQAEAHMMSTFFEELRLWVRQNAQDYVLKYFKLLRERREAHYSAHIIHLTSHAAYYRQSPHPSELAQAEAELKRGIDEDWRTSVQRYPEVLEYYYSLVNFLLPSSEDPVVSDPPLSAMAGARKMGGRVRIMEPGAGRAALLGGPLPSAGGGFPGGLGGLPGLGGLGLGAMSGVGAPRTERGGARRERRERRTAWG